jgi:hypothetical protein
MELFQSKLFIILFTIFLCCINGLVNNIQLFSSLTPMLNSMSLSGGLKSHLSKLSEKIDLTKAETEEAMDEILAADAINNPAAVGALLALLRAKGE